MLKCIHCGNVVHLENEICEHCGKAITLESVVGDSLPEMLYWIQVKKGTSVLEDVKRLNGYLADLIISDCTEVKIFKRLSESGVIDKTKHFFDDFSKCRVLVKKYLCANEGLSEEWSELIFRDLLICNDYHQWEVECDFTIQEDVLVKCKSQAEVIYIPDGIRKIGEEALANLPVKQILFNESVEVIASGAFSCCHNLTMVRLNPKVRVIEEMAFANCDNLEEITLPKGIEYLSSWAFDGCVRLSQLQSYSLKYDVLNGAVFEEKLRKLLFVLPGANIEKYVLPEECNEISEGAFKDNRSLKHILLQNRMKVVDMYSFENCISLQIVEAPLGIEKIGWRAFAGCTGLREMRLGADIVDIQFNAFEDCNKLKVFSNQYAPVLQKYCKLQSITYEVGEGVSY